MSPFESLLAPIASGLPYSPVWCVAFDGKTCSRVRPRS